LEKKKGERQLDALGAGTHELHKQTETNWNMFFRKILHVALYRCPTNTEKNGVL